MRYALMRHGAACRQLPRSAAVFFMPPLLRGRVFATCLCFSPSLPPWQKRHAARCCRRLLRHSMLCCHTKERAGACHADAFRRFTPAQLLCLRLPATRCCCCLQRHFSCRHARRASYAATLCYSSARAAVVRAVLRCRFCRFRFFASFHLIFAAFSLRAMPRLQPPIFAVTLFAFYFALYFASCCAALFRQCHCHACFELWLGVALLRFDAGVCCAAICVA